jgi:nucleotide-binding universal stress UspA family protein
MNGVTQSPKPQSSASISTIEPQCILVPTDFSEFSSRALKTAAALAKQINSTLLIVNAVSAAVYTTGFEPVVPVEPLEVQIESARADMERQIAGIPELEFVKHEEIIDVRPLIAMVHEISQKRNVGMIVAGSHGAHGFEKMVLGSTAEALLREATCPVLVVGPFAMRDLALKSILYATDLDPDAAPAAQFAASLATRFHSQLTFFHASKEPAHGESQTLLIAQATHRLQNLLPTDVKVWPQPKCRVIFGDPASKVLETATEENADLIVMGVREHSRFADHAPWHTLSKVIQKATCPVLAVRGNLDEPV